MRIGKTTLAWVAGLMVAGAALAQPYGGHGMGPGMMGGHGGDHGMQGAMGGHGGGCGMGAGMMGGGWGAAAYPGLDLTAEQKKQIAAIQQDSRKATWALMGTMHEQGYHMHDLVGPAAVDEAAVRKAFEQMQSTQKAMFDQRLDARKKIDAVLTPEQRQQLRR